MSKCTRRWIMVIFLHRAGSIMVIGLVAQWELSWCYGYWMNLDNSSTMVMHRWNWNEIHCKCMSYLLIEYTVQNVYVVRTVWSTLMQLYSILTYFLHDRSNKISKFIFRTVKCPSKFLYISKSKRIVYWNFKNCPKKYLKKTLNQ